MPNTKQLTAIAFFLANLLVGFLLANWLTSQTVCPQARGCILIPHLPLVLAPIYALALLALQRSLIRTWQHKSFQNLVISGLLLVSPSLLNLMFVFWLGTWGSHQMLWFVMLLWSILLVRLEIWLNPIQQAPEIDTDDEFWNINISGKQVLSAIGWFFANAIVGYMMGLYAVNDIPCNEMCLGHFFAPFFFALIYGLLLLALQRALLKAWHDNHLLSMAVSGVLLLSPFWLNLIRDFWQTTWQTAFILSAVMLLCSLPFVFWQVQQANAEQARERASKEANL